MKKKPAKTEPKRVNLSAVQREELRAKLELIEDNARAALDILDETRRVVRFTEDLESALDYVQGDAQEVGEILSALIDAQEET